MDEAQAAVDRSRQAWVDAVNARDVDEYAALFTEDAVWVPPGLDALSGRETIRAWLRPFFEQYDYDFSLEHVTCRVAGGWAVERGEFVSALTPADGGQTMTHGGSYVVLWRRGKDGTWRIERYADVSELA